MNTIEKLLIPRIKDAVKTLYKQEITDSLVQIQKTRKEFDGDFTLVVFPLLKSSRKSPEQTGADIGKYLTENANDISGFNVIKGFLNLILSNYF